MEEKIKIKNRDGATIVVLLERVENQKGLVFVAHGLGGLTTLTYAENHPDKVKCMTPISSVISGKLSVSSDKYKKILETWKETGWREETSVTVPGRVKRLKWSHIEDRMQYDVLKKAEMLTMPVLLIVGELDDGTPPEHQQQLFDALPGPKQMHIIKGASHNFRRQKHLDEIYKTLDVWIKKLRLLK